MTGLATLLRVGLRTGWVGVLLLPAIFGAVLVIVASAVMDLFDSPEERAVYAHTVGEFIPSIAFNGRGYELETLGGIVTNELGIMALLILPALGIFTAVRLTRAVEDSGRLELLTSGQVSRSAPTVSGMVLGLISVATLCVITAVGLIMVGLPAAGSVRYSAALGGLTAAHLAAGWIAAQVSRDARTAYGTGLSIALVFYLIRMIVDIRGWEATWLSPSSWAAEVRPWAEHPPLWPLVAYSAVVIVGLSISWIIAAGRDLGDGLLSTRPGPAQASALLRGPWQLSLRLVRGGFISWLVGLSLFAFGFGFIAEEMSALTENNAQLADLFGAGLDSMVALVLLLVSLGAAASGLSSVSNLIGEESSGRTGLVLAAPISRMRWWLGIGILAGLHVVVTLIAASTALAASMVLALDDHSWWATCLNTAGALIPPALMVVALALLLGAVAPALRHLTWGLLAWTFVATMFGELLELPGWTASISPWEWVGQVPIDPVEWTTTTVISALALLSTALSGVMFSRRELIAG